MENSVTFDAGLEYGATFRFPVTWSYITTPAESPDSRKHQNAATPKPLKAVQPISMPPVEVVDPPQQPQAESPAPTPVQAKVEPPTQLVPAKSQRGSGVSEAKWEMVIPKMARPISLNKQRPPRALPQPSPPPEAEAPTEISFYAGSEASFLPRRWKLFGIGAAVVVVGAAIALVRPGNETSSAADTAPAASGTWSRRTAYVVGARDPRDILVFSGSDGLKNYRIEFVWVPDARGVGWIFRATDSANYYASKLRLIQAGAAPTLSAEHFAVVKGVEGTHSRKVIALGRTNNQVLVRMDASGPGFTLYLQGSPADYWTDERFEKGSLGFFEDRGERPVLQSVRFTLFKKTGLQTVVTSLQ